MSLRFDNFKQQIPSQILTRGREYYRQKQILDLSFDEGDLVWEAQIEGTDVYDVRVELSESGALRCSCTCPYDMGDYCKHVAALLYAIEDSFPEYTGKKPRAKSKRPNRQERLHAALVNMPHDQLVKIIFDLAAQDKQFFNRLEISVGAGGNKPADYARLVKDALRAGKGDYGYIDYHGAMRAGRKLDELLAMAERQLDEGQPERAAAIYQAVLENVPKAMENADDSNGALGNAIEAALDGLEKAGERLGRADRQKLFSYCIEQSKLRGYAGGELRWEFWQIAAALVETEEQRAILFDHLGASKAPSYVVYGSGGTFMRDFDAEQGALIQLRVIERLDGERAAHDFINNHLHMNVFRQLLIERHINEGQFEAAKNLVLEGMAKHQSLPGLMTQYRRWLLIIAQKMNDREEIIAQARRLWLGEPFDAGPYYALLKQTVLPQDWPVFITKLINEMKGQPAKLTWVYAQEDRWSEVLSMVRQDQGVHLLEHYRAELEKRFPDEIAALYTRWIDSLMEGTWTGRKVYQQACGYIERIRQMGHDAQAKAIIADLKARYPQRRALIEELNKL